MIRPVPAWVRIVIAFAVGIAGGCSKQSQIEQLLARGDEAFAAGDYERAEKEFLEVLRVVPGEPNALGRLGILCYHQGRLIEGYAMLDQAIQKVPDNPDFRLTYGLASLSLRRTVDARAAARKVLESRPKDEVAALLLAETCITTRDNEEAKRLIEGLQASNGEAAGYHVALGLLHRAQRNYPAAEAELQRALELDPKSSAAYHQLSNLHAARGNADASADALRQAAELAPVRSPIRLKYVHHLLQQGRREEAQLRLAELIAQAPDRIPALVLRMQLEFSAGRMSDASATAKKILERDRSNYEALLQLASIKAAAGDQNGVVSELKRAEEFYERVPQIKFQLALAHLKLGDLYTAEDNLKKALSLAPNYDEALLLLAELYQRKGDASAAIAVLNPLVQRKPGLRAAQVRLAQAHRAQGDVARSVAILRSLVQREPQRPDNHFLLGLSLAGRDHAGARAAFEQAVTLAPDHWPAQQMLIEDDLRAQCVGEAAARVETLVESHPDHAFPWLLRARTRQVAGDLEGAESDLIKTLELDPKLQVAHLRLSRIYFEKGAGEQAVKTLAESAQRTNSAGAFTQLGMLHSALGQPDRARAAYEQALAADANFVPALNNLAMLHAERFGDLEQALKLARQANDRMPGDALVADTLGWILYLQGQVSTALPLLESSAERLPGEPSIIYHLAMVHYALGQEEAARETLERALAAGAEAALAEEARARLAVLAIDPASAGPTERERLVQRIETQPADVGALERLGLIEARIGDPKQAAEWLEAAVKVNPRSLRSLVGLVELYSGPLARPERAGELFKTARAAAALDGGVNWKLGVVALRLGDFPGAVAALHDAARLLPDEPGVQVDLAHALYAVGRVNEAEESLRTALTGKLREPQRHQAQQTAAMLSALKSPADIGSYRAAADERLKADPAYTPALMVVAADLTRHGDHRGAERIYSQILDRNPAFVPATRQLALLYAEQLGDDDKAEELALKARQAQSDDPDLAYVLGSVSYRRADYAAAVRYLRQALRQRADHAQSAFLLGMALFYQENAPESRTQLERALQLGLGAQEASEAERVLQELSGARRSF